MSFAVRALGALSIPVITVPLAAAADAAAVPKPPTKSLPTALDIAPPYQGQKVCEPTAKAGVLAFAQLMTSHYKVGTSAYGIVRSCNSGITEHSEGRAWDWMLNAGNPQQKAVADAVTAWLSAPDAQGRPGAMARRFGIMYIIWNKRMWRAYDPARGWAPYTGSSPHTDHIHFSFTWDGAYKRTSWWTGRAVTTIDPGPKLTPANAPKPTTTPQTPEGVYSILLIGARGADVALAQRVIGATPDGIFGPQTQAALRAWQSAHGLKASGQLDATTWAKMVVLKLVPARSGTAPSAKPATPTAKPPTPSPLTAYAHTTLRRGSTGAAVAALQRALKITVDGQFGPQTDAAVRAFQARKNLPANGIVGATTWRALIAATTTPPATTSSSPAPSRSSSGRITTPYTAVMSTVLKVGARGNAVRVLQRALGGLAVDGAYGVKTAASVTAFQRAHRLPATGVADGRVWRALEARDYPHLRYYGTVLRKGSSGAAVVALQRALRVGADGRFGPVTEAAVKALQGRAKIARTGVVATLTWQALDAELRRR